MHPFDTFPEIINVLHKEEVNGYIIEVSHYRTFTRYEQKTNTRYYRDFFKCKLTRKKRLFFGLSYSYEEVVMKLVDFDDNNVADIVKDLKSYIEG